MLGQAIPRAEHHVFAVVKLVGRPEFLSRDSDFASGTVRSRRWVHQRTAFTGLSDVGGLADVRSAPESDIDFGVRGRVEMPNMR
jgi:hypothetical protein